MTGPLILRPFRLDDEAEARAAHHELAADHFDFLLEQRADGGPEETWAEYVERLETLKDVGDLCALLAGEKR